MIRSQNLRGIFQVPSGKWSATISINNRKEYLGCFTTKATTSSKLQGHWLQGHWLQGHWLCCLLPGVIDAGCPSYPGRGPAGPAAGT
jgi:hypothetical protein